MKIWHLAVALFLAILAFAVVAALGGPTAVRAATDASEQMPVLEAPPCQTMDEVMHEAEYWRQRLNVPVFVIFSADGDAAILTHVIPGYPTTLNYRFENGCAVRVWEAPL